MAEENEAVLAIVRDVLGRPGIELDDDLFDVGATSLSFVRVLARVHQELKVQVSPAVLGGAATPRAIAAQVRNAALQPAAGQ